jgi:MFS family permease
MSTTTRTPAGSDDPVVIRESATTLPLPARHVSWGAVLAGMVIAVVVQLVLSLVGAGVGLGAFDPLGFSSPDASTFGISAGIWWAVSSAIALFLGGWVAGHLCGSLEKTDAVLHGLLTWGLGTIVTVYLITAMVSSVVRGGAAVVGKTASLASSGVAAAAGPAADAIRSQLPPGTLESMKTQAASLLGPSGQAASAAARMTDPAASAAATSPPAGQDVEATLMRVIASGKDTVEPADREAIVSGVVARAGVGRPEAEQRVDAWIRQYQDARAGIARQRTEAEAKARRVADDAAEVSSKAALAAAAALVLGAIAGALGGLAGRRRPRRFVGSATTTTVGSATATSGSAGGARG